MRLLLLCVIFVLGNLGNTLRLPSTSIMIQNLEQKLDAKISNLEGQIKLESKQLRADISLIFENLIDFEDKIKSLLTGQNNNNDQTVGKIDDNSKQHDDRFKRIEVRMDEFERALKNEKNLKEEFLDTVKAINTAVSLMSDDIGKIRDNLEVLRKSSSVVEESVEELSAEQSSAHQSINEVKEKFKYVEQNAIFCERLVECAREVHSSCSDGVTRSGVYKIQLPDFPIFEAYCDMDTDGGGWMVFQRRKDGSVDFYRNWTDYKHGFGQLSGDFWLGNDIIHKLTSTPQELRIDMWDWDGSTRYAKYGKFSIGPESDKYRLHISGFSGTVQDCITNSHTLDSSLFSTKDQDNDNSNRHCAVELQGAWWYDNCAVASLNGHYYPQAHFSGNHFGGLSWVYWANKPRFHYSLKGTEMKIRRK